MGDPQIQAEVQSGPGEPSGTNTALSPLFAAPAQEPANRSKVIGAALAFVMLLLIAGAFFMKSGHTAPAASQSAVLPPDSYASSLIFTQLAMSQSTSLSGGTSTFIDGHVKNSGPNTLAGVTMQVIFRNDVGMPPQVVTVPLTLIRTHEPYVDTQSVSSAPLKPGDDVEFRLIVETVTANWNQQMPDLLVIHVLKL